METFSIINQNKEILYSVVAFLLTTLKSDFAIENYIFRSIYVETNLRLQSKQSTSERGSFGLETETGFRFPFHLSEFGVDYTTWSGSSAHNKHGGGMGFFSLFRYKWFELLFFFYVEQKILKLEECLIVVSFIG